MNRQNTWVKEYVDIVSEMWDRGEMAQGRKLLQSVLHEEPDSAMAHNLAGWYAHTQLKERKLAHKHFEWAILFDPRHGATYYNFSELLFEERNLPRLKKLVEEGMKHPDVDKASLLNDYGRLLEIDGQYKMAAAQYKTAMKYTMNTWMMDTIKDNRKRARSKYRLFSAFYSPLL